jgi:hypothetical protein
MLDPLVPLTFVDRAIGPVHLSVPISLVFYICTFVNVATLPGEYSFTIFFVIEIVAFVLIAVGFISK